MMSTWYINVLVSSLFPFLPNRLIAAYIARLSRICLNLDKLSYISAEFTVTRRTSFSSPDTAHSWISRNHHLNLADMPIISKVEEIRRPRLSLLRLAQDLCKTALFLSGFLMLVRFFFKDKTIVIFFNPIVVLGPVCKDQAPVCRLYVQGTDLYCIIIGDQ